jgi:mannose-6-phosphate isomerase-like protein (cupin superfamily)
MIPVKIRTARPSTVRHGSALTFETLVGGDDEVPTRMRPRDDTLLRVIAGVLRLCIGGQQRLLGTGDEAIIPAGSAHQLVSAGGEARIVTGFRLAHS